MAVFKLWTLPKSQVSITNGVDLNGVTQGDGSHLMGEAITLNAPAWTPVDISDNDNFFADNDGTQQLEGAQTYDGVSYADNTRVEAEYKFVVTDGTNNYTIIGFNLVEPGGPNPYGTIEGLAFLDEGLGFPPTGTPLKVIKTGEGPGQTETLFDSYAEPICFCEGTLIETPDGQRQVETLQVGDLVITRDHGLQEVQWARQRTMTRRELAARPNFRPIMIFPHAFGADGPDRLLRLSPQHRVLVNHPDVALIAGLDAALCSARHLENGTTVRPDTHCLSVTYVHIGLAEHAVVRAEGMWCETFLPHPRMLGNLPNEAREELLYLFPELSSDIAVPPGYCALTGPEVRSLQI